MDKKACPVCGCKIISNIKLNDDVFINPFGVRCCRCGKTVVAKTQQKAEDKWEGLKR